ncbi:GerMN domain-containing protein [Paenibacillus tuaregi]|uniref:GerMN domain-containing protein n=1 Tax=Paenibacillus tuaregi TaxID=1816681 RepID=UPI000839325B|nr:GerMN domain-containing protein [Paenibacillus tuaregi]
MKRKLWIITLLVVVVGISAGCGQKPQSAGGVNNTQGSEGTTSSGDQTASKTPSEANNGQQQVQGNSGSNGSGNTGSTGKTGNTGTNESETKSVKTTIEAYYTDDQMLELKKVQKEITYTEAKDKYEAAVKSLQSSGDSKLFALWGKVEFKSVSFKDGQLTVDIHLPDEARLGAGGESLAIDALKKTAFQFDEVKSLELLVDGQQADTLMGHVELTHPMTRE